MVRQPRYARFYLSIAVFVSALLLAPTDARALTAPDPRVLLYVGAFVTWAPNDVLCVEDREGAAYHPVLWNGSVLGPVDFSAPWNGSVLGPINFLAPYTYLPDGHIIIRAGTRTVVLEVLSSLALVDGRRVDLGRPVEFIEPPGLPVTSLDRLAPLLGYRLLIGTTRRGSMRDISWIIRLPQGAAIPRAIRLAKRALVDGAITVLLLDSPLVSPDEWNQCGKIAWSSGALDPYGDEPWGDLRLVAGELGWSVTWDARRRVGSVRAGTRRVAVRITAKPIPTVLIDGQAYPAHRFLAARLEAGQPIVPVVAVATKLGWRAWRFPRVGSIMRLSKRGPYP